MMLSDVCMPLHQLAFLSLSVSRLLGVCLIFPLFGKHSVGGAFNRNAVVLLLSLPIFSAHTALFKSLSPTILELVLWIAKELLLGVFIGYAVSIPFWAIDSASVLIDTLRGASMGTTLNPLLGEQSSGLGLFFTQVLASLFLAGGGFNAFLHFLYHSYTPIPINGGIHFSISWLSFAKTAWTLMLTLALRFALPAILLMLIIDIALGLLNRSAHQINVFLLSMPMKGMSTFFVLAVSLSFAFTLYTEQMTATLGLLRESLQGLYE